MDGFTIVVQQVNQTHGIWPTPACMIAKECATYDRDVYMEPKDEPERRANCRSIMEVMMLAATQGQVMCIQVEGEDDLASELSLRLATILDCPDIHDPRIKDIFSKKTNNSKGQ